MTAFWMPATLGVELRGGPKDCEHTEVSVIGDQMTFSTPGLPGPGVIEYTLGGWHEQKRRWLCDVAPCTCADG